MDVRAIADVADDAGVPLESSITPNGDAITCVVRRNLGRLRGPFYDQIPHGNGTVTGRSDRRPNARQI